MEPIHVTLSREMNELELLAEADRRAHAYLADVDARPVFPSATALAGLANFDEPVPELGAPAEDTLARLDEFGTPRTVVSAGPNYYGFVIGATLPAAAAAERLALAWDQCGSSWANSPIADTLEKVAARWVLELLDLPRTAAVGFGTSATACGLACLATARRELLGRAGWNFDEGGLAGAPDIRVVVSEAAHITVSKASRSGPRCARLVALVSPSSSNGTVGSRPDSRADSRRRASRSSIASRSTRCSRGSRPTRRRGH